MADISPLVPAGRQVLESYGHGRFRVSGEVYEGSILVFPERIEAWPVASLGDLTLASLASVVAHAPEVLLLGCGERLQLISGALRGELRAAGIVVEPMDTGAAARTYNVLLAEERRVAAALIAIR